MSKSEDVNTLYRRFGGNAGTYQEIGASEMAGAATRRWPILGELRPQSHREAPDAQKGSAAIGERQVSSFLTPVGRTETVPPLPERVESMTVGYEERVAAPQNSTVPKGSESHVTEAVAEPRHVPTPEPVQRPAAKAAAKSAPRSRRAVRGGGRAETPKAEVVEQPVAHTSKKPVAEKLKKPAAALPPAEKQSQPKKRAPSAPVEDSRPEAGSELQSLFNRLVPPKPEDPAVSSPVRLKRLVKW